ncbi:phage tail protein [Amylibacter kogurei]|uniref:Phage tail protein n=2 Tax=Paramylibacter kogurei TaxID=1889778 RepID=A0A2G5K6I1_9RHOB|nr:head-tail adaptor protein [Amylibacter kogurei]PIB25166.1 phage tail protein [Amylibacter kogurei]
MDAAQLTRKLVLETPVRIGDGAGGFTQTWQALGALWAHVSAKGVSERAHAGGTLSTLRHEITVRNAPIGDDQRPKPEQRFVEGTRIFIIETVAEADAFGRFLTCVAREEGLT